MTVRATQYTLTSKNGVCAGGEYRYHGYKLGVGCLGSLHRVDGQLLAVNVARGDNYIFTLDLPAQETHWHSRFYQKQRRHP